MSTETQIAAYADPGHPGNGPAHLSGKACVEKGCKNPAGTLWSPFWCHEHNVARMDRIGRSLDAELAYRTGSTG